MFLKPLFWAKYVRFKLPNNHAAMSVASGNFTYLHSIECWYSITLHYMFHCILDCAFKL